LIELVFFKKNLKARFCGKGNLKGGIIAHL
jgi:hypothetical protein